MNTRGQVTEDGMAMQGEQKNNPLHGITLERMILDLVERFGWEQMGQKIRIRCFTTDPSVMSSLKFLRRTPWARAKVEDLYLKLRKTGSGRKEE